MPKIKKDKSQDEKPYDRSSSPPTPNPASAKDKKSTKQSKLDLPSIKGNLRENKKVTRKSDYDKSLLVTLVIKTAKDTRWEDLAKEVNKTPTQCKDLWRKVIQPLLCTNSSWANDGTGWTSEMKVKTLMTILESCTPNWVEIADSFPGKTKSQVNDVWREVILPRLKKGNTIE
ncbi:uncharacterized protein L201_005013 [Kwoniella dendrophila CBS 6074]|uniref:Myb-like domain-containing protein n=1 Tax=Kwoniella dendrophila CBS 6074 TaxID=1295534 RepID=A0AAX4JZR9_9TREE